MTRRRARLAAAALLLAVLAALDPGAVLVGGALAYLAALVLFLLCPCPVCRAARMDGSWWRP